MRIRAGRRRLAGLALAMTAPLVLAGCGGGGDGPSSADRTTTTAPVGGPGTPMADGLVVPAGATLVALLRAPPGVGDVSSADSTTTVPVSADDAPWTALLTIEGDPFAAFDDLAGQLRDRTPSVPVPGTADACLWQRAHDGSGDPDEGGRRQELEARFVTAPAPPADVVGVLCQAGASGEAGPDQRSAALTLRASTSVPATLTLRVERGATLHGFEVRTTALATTALATLDGLLPDAYEAGPGAAGPEAAAALPAPAPQPEAAPGDEFGQEVNCFDGGTSRFRLPEGARLLADGFDDGTVSVLAVESDLATVVDDLVVQAAGSDPSPGVEVEVRQVDVGGGTEITRASVVISAGGGGCTVESSPDGTVLRLARFSD